MKIVKEYSGTECAIKLAGELDTNAEPSLRTLLTELFEKDIDKFTTLIIDCNELTYISSAGLRVLHFAKKRITEEKKDLKIIHVCDDVMYVLDMVGFTKILCIV